MGDYFDTDSADPLTIYDQNYDLLSTLSGQDPKPLMVGIYSGSSVYMTFTRYN